MRHWIKQQIEQLKITCIDNHHPPSKKLNSAEFLICINKIETKIILHSTEFYVLLLKSVLSLIIIASAQNNFL